MFEITGFRFRVQAFIQLTKAEVEHMIKCSEHHYDLKCQQASQQGGFLYGWCKRFEWGNEVEEVRVDWDMMDTLCKILEGEQYLVSSDLHLCFKCCQLLKQMQEEERRVNAQT
jgi:hypothetical protein